MWETPSKGHVVVVVANMTPQTLKNVLQYLYLGEVILDKKDINHFMDAADSLNICGVLANLYSCDISSTETTEDQRKQFETESDASETRNVSETAAARGISEYEDSEFRGSHSSGLEDTPKTPVIKYQGIKSRWRRRYSNTSFHGTPSKNSSDTCEQKRSASAGEVDLAPETTDERTNAGSMLEKSQAVVPEQNTTQVPSVVDLTIPDDEDRFEEDRSGTVESPHSKHRKIIQRAYPKDYSTSFDDSSDTNLEDWRTQSLFQSGFNPLTAPASTAVRPTRSLPYTIGSKDFSHPLQVSVDSQSPYGTNSPTSSTLEQSKAKSHSGFFPSSHSLPFQRTMHNSEPHSSTFTAAQPPLSLFSSHSREDRGLKYRLSAGLSPSVPSSSTYHRRQEFPSRSNYSLPPTETWSFSDTRSPSQFDETSREPIIEGRFRSDSMSLERSLSSYGSSKTYMPQTSHAMRLGDFAAQSHSFASGSELPTGSMSQHFSGSFLPQLRSPSSSTASTRPKTKAIRSSQVPQSSRYTAAEVDQMVDAVANYPGNIVPCTLCQKFVKRERLRAHIHECHLLSGEKIICPHCGIALKSKGSFRVHIWRHKRGALPTRNSMTDFGKGPPPSSASGPASH
ncbi:Modifier of mdg4 [Orchesella cincta]|uniref:Modifier of mdg4 n=1 Tax=Orchesella cincta TaxID=48709 RepID=A0A1D2NFL3_ORCCI|nr:Modifier of mdg4 [Orchesella cincta]